MWILSAFEKDNDAHVLDQLLEGIDVADVRRLWSLPASNPAYDSYPVDEKIAAELLASADLQSTSTDSITSLNIELITTWDAMVADPVLRL